LKPLERSYFRTILKLEASMGRLLWVVPGFYRD
jgi:hypothetical protein